MKYRFFIHTDGTYRTFCFSDNSKSVSDQISAAVRVIARKMNIPEDSVEPVDFTYGDGEYIDIK